jgi:hypothetical protein
MNTQQNKGAQHIKAQAHTPMMQQRNSYDL